MTDRSFGGTPTVPHGKIPTYLNPEQRRTLSQIPLDLSDRDIARYYTFTQKELDPEPRYV